MQDALPSRGGRAAVEVLGLTLLVTVVVALLGRMGNAFVTENLTLLVGIVFLVAAVMMARREADGMRRFGIDLAGVLDPPEERSARDPFGLFDLGKSILRAAPQAARETGIALAVSAIVFPTFILGFLIWNPWAIHFQWPPLVDTPSFMSTQVLAIALPEEAFFRGYVQTRLGDVGSRTRALVGVQVPVAAWLAQAAVFAVVHFAVDPNPARLAVFFPALLFGWLRAWRGGIGAAVLVHAGSNLLSDILHRGYAG